MGDAEASPAASAGDGPTTLGQRSGPCSALIADEGASFAIYAAERGHRAAHDGWTRNPLAPDYRTYGGTEIPTASARPQSAGTFEISLKM